MGSRRPLPDGIESVALGLGVGAGLGAFSILWTFFGLATSEAVQKAVPVEAAVTAALAFLCFGFCRGWAWVWWVTFAIAATGVCLTVGASVWVVWGFITHVEDCHNPYGLLGLYCGAVLLPIAFLVFGTPTFLLLRDRKRYGQLRSGAGRSLDRGRPDPSPRAPGPDRHDHGR